MVVKRRTVDELRELLTVEYVDRMMEYNPEDGHLYWARDLKIKKEGDMCAHLCQSATFKVWKVRIFTNDVSVVNLIWMKVYKRKPKGIIEYKDGDTLNTKIENLRETSKNFPVKSWLYDESTAINNKSGVKKLSHRTAPQVYNTPKIERVAKGIHMDFNNSTQKYVIKKGQKKLFEFRNECLAKRKLKELIE